MRIAENREKPVVDLLLQLSSQARLPSQQSMRKVKTYTSFKEAIKAQTGNNTTIGSH